MREPGAGEDLVFDKKTEVKKAGAIRRIRKFERRWGFSLTGDTFEFIGRLCTCTDLSSLVDPNTLRVPLTDTMSVGIQRVTVKESLASETNSHPKSKEVTIPVFYFENTLDGVKFDGRSADTSNSILKQKRGRAFRDLYRGEDRIDYTKAVEELLIEAYLRPPYSKRLDFLKIAAESDLLLHLGLKGFVKEDMWKVQCLDRKEVAEKFIQAIDPKATGQGASTKGKIEQWLFGK